MTQGNIVATAAGVMTVIPKLGRNDVFLAYLPLAHVFELEAEVTSNLQSSSSIFPRIILNVFWLSRQ